MTPLPGAGRPAEVRAAIVQWAATADQRTVIGSLFDLPVLAAAASIGPPATLVVGGVAGLAREIAVPSPAEAAEVRLGG